MDHVVYLDAREKELDKLFSGAAGRGYRARSTVAPLSATRRSALQVH